MKAIETCVLAVIFDFISAEQKSLFVCAQTFHFSESIAKSGLSTVKLDLDIQMFSAEFEIRLGSRPTAQIVIDF